MINKIAIILNGPIRNDARVIKIVNSISMVANVDLFYTSDNSKEDQDIFSNSNINLFNIKYPRTIYQNLLRHTFFYKEFDFFLPVITQQREKYDIVYCNDLPTLNVGVRIKKISNSKIIYDSHEIYIETINQFFLKGNNLFKNIIFELLIFFMKNVGKRFEQKAISNTDYMLTVNESLKNYFIKHYSVQNIDFLYNTPTLSTENNYGNNLRKLLDLNNNDIIFLYQGVFNSGRGLELLINSFDLVKNKNAKLIMIGDGILFNKLKSIVEKKGLGKKILFLGYIKFTELDTYTKQADWGIFFLEPFNISTYMASPNKIFQYIHAEVPILTNYSPENDRMFEQFEIGVQSSLNSIDIAKNIDEICYYNRKQYITECQKAKNKYTWEVQEKKLLNIIDKIV